MLSFRGSPLCYLNVTIFIALVLTSLKCLAIQLPDLYWNSSNAFFQQTDNPAISASIKDRLNTHCPHYTTLSKYGLEYAIIYQVSKWGYDNCILDGSAEVLISCSTPLAATKPLSLTFREYSPNPSIGEFKSGNDYYFLSTSTGMKSGLRQTSGGLCHNHNLRLKIHINKRRSRTNDFPRVESKVNLPGEPLSARRLSNHYIYRHGYPVAHQSDLYWHEPAVSMNKIHRSSTKVPKHRQYLTGPLYQRSRNHLKDIEVLIEYRSEPRVQSIAACRQPPIALLLLALISPLGLSNL